MTTDDRYFTGLMPDDILVLANIQRWNERTNMITNVDKATTTGNMITPVQPQTTTTIRPKRGERGTGTTITIDLTELPELLAKIKAAAQADDREPSKWVRRRLVQLGATLFAAGGPDVSDLEGSRG
jgi:hypothetical protein